MILTCPECASRYQVADDSIPPQGRTVRCVGCGASWRAEAARTDEPLLELKPAASETPEAAQPETAKPAGSALPRSFRAKTQAHRRTREAAVAGAVWGALAAVLVAVVVGSALFRVEVVRLWPRTAGAYAKVGLPVNPTGLAPENILAGPGLKDGYAAVLVSGTVRNVEARSHDPAPLRVALLDKTGHVLTSQIVRIAAGQLQPGQSRPFSAAFLDPPSAATNVQVEFALDLIEKPHRKAAKPAQVADAHAPRLRGLAEAAIPPGPEPKHAQPLPADSPYALPVAAQANAHPAHEG